MEVAGMALAIIGYALLYTGASNLFTGGHGWGFLQSLLNKGEANTSGGFSGLLNFGNSNNDGGIIRGPFPLNP